MGREYEIKHSIELGNGCMSILYILLVVLLIVTINLSPTFQYWVSQLGNGK